MTEHRNDAVRECPFCGAAMAHCTDKDGEFWMHPGFVTDDDCFMSGQGVFPRQLTAWNARALSPSPASSPETLAQKQAREIMNPGFGSAIAASGGQSYNALASSPVAEEWIERMARVIDPTAWEYRDDALTRRKEWDEIANCWPELTFEQWANRGVQGSLEKARAVAALSPSSGEPARHSTIAEQFKAIEAGRRLDAEDGGYPEPASVAVEAETRLQDIAAERAAQIRSSCFDYCTGDCNCAKAAEDAVSEMDRLIAALSKPTPVESGAASSLPDPDHDRGRGLA